LSRYSQDAEVVYGSVVSGRPPELKGIENTVGAFINTLPVRVVVERASKVRPWLKRLQEKHLEIRDYEYTPLMEIKKWSDLEADARLFHTVMAFENYELNTDQLTSVNGLNVIRISGLEQTNLPLTVAAMPRAGLTLQIRFDQGKFDR